MKQVAMVDFKTVLVSSGCRILFVGNDDSGSGFLAFGKRASKDATPTFKISSDSASQAKYQWPSSDEHHTLIRGPNDKEIRLDSATKHVDVEAAVKMLQDLGIKRAEEKVNAVAK